MWQWARRHSCDQTESKSPMRRRLRPATPSTAASGKHADGSYFSGFDASVWTGCAEPIASCVETCSDWSSNSSSVMGIEGFSAQTDTAWWDYFEGVGCNSSKPVYCLEQ